MSQAQNNRVARNQAAAGDAIQTPINIQIQDQDSSSKAPYMQNRLLAVPYPTRIPNFQIVPLHDCPASSTGMDYSWDRSTTPRLVRHCAANIRSRIQI